MKANKKDLKYLIDSYWKNYWDNYPYFHHQRIRFGGYFNRRYSRPHRELKNPKLKKNVFYAKEYALYNSCPKWFNKLHHIRPCRRQDKLFARQSMTLDDDLIYLAEERYYPDYKLHVYYW